MPIRFVMSPPLRPFAALLVLCFALAAPPRAVADNPGPASIIPVPHGFEHFCSTWMGKLAKREENNLAKAKLRKAGSGVVLSYTGYAKRPVKCSARESGISGNPYVGKVVYLEFAYERRGANRRAALEAEPEVVSRTEVLEIFRHDGSDWIY
jgi:hypothetical protein